MGAMNEIELAKGPEQATRSWNQALLDFARNKSTSTGQGLEVTGPDGNLRMRVAPASAPKEQAHR